MIRNSPFGVGRLMRAAICGLLAAIAIPAAASAQLGDVVTVTPPSTPAPVLPTVTAPTVSVPAAAVPSVKVSTSVSTPVASAHVTASAPSVSTTSPSSRAQSANTNAKGKSSKRKRSHTKQSGTSSRSFLQASTTVARPFAGPIANPCFAGDVLLIEGVSKLTTIVQSDGDFLVRNTVNGTGVSTTTGAKYAFSGEQHGDFHISIGQTSFYDYHKLNRQGDATGIPVIIDPPTGVGDDFIVRFFFDFPLGSGGIPSPNSLNTTMDGACR